MIKKILKRKRFLIKLFIEKKLQCIMNMIENFSMQKKNWCKKTYVKNFLMQKNLKKNVTKKNLYKNPKKFLIKKNFWSKNCCLKKI